MKTKHFTIVMFISLVVIIFNSYGQLVVKNFSPADSKIGGECLLIKSTIDVNDNIALKTFEVDVMESGSYYLTVLQHSYENKKINVKIDDVPFGTVETTRKEGLDTYQIIDAPDNGQIKLTKGKHLIKFELDDKFIPPIDYISLSKEVGKSNIDLTKVKQEMSELKSKILGNYKKDATENTGLALKVRANLGDENIIEGYPKSYDYALNIDYKYTFYRNFYFTAGQNVILDTYASNCDPVMELMSDNCQYSWVNDDYNGYESRINIVAPVSGVYCMRIRPYNSNSNGISNLKLNDNILVTNIPIQWTYVNVVNQAPFTGEKNYFTTKHHGEDLNSCDTYIWLEGGSTIPGKIIARNDDYQATGDFYWGATSRIKKSFTEFAQRVWVNAYSQLTESTCDMYVKAPTMNDPDLFVFYTELDTDDAIESAPEDLNYICFSWSGGIYNYLEIPDLPQSNFYNWATYDSINGQTDPLSCYDRYYGNDGNDGNPRYTGAIDYYRCEDNANVEIDLWGVDDIDEIDYSHASVCKLGNDQTHGYSWESKIGGDKRIFHPRNALESTVYGQVLYHYARSTALATRLAKVETSTESVNFGLSVMENEQLSDIEKQSLKNFKTKFDKITLATFDEKYNKWKETWTDKKLSINSNPRRYAESKEYNDILDYCTLNGKKFYPLVIEKLSDGDFFAIILLNDLTLKENSYLLKEVNNENKRKPMNEDGTMIVRTPYSNAIKYARKLLSKENIIELPQPIFDPMTVTVATNGVTGLFQINMTCENEMAVNIDIYDTSGKSNCRLVSNYKCNQGINTFSAGISDFKNGIYICKVSGKVDKLVKFLVRK